VLVVATNAITMSTLLPMPMSSWLLVTMMIIIAVVSVAIINYIPDKKMKTKHTASLRKRLTRMWSNSSEIDALTEKED